MNPPDAVKPARPFTLTGPDTGQAAACALILRALPDWFGVQAAVEDYIRAVNELPTVVAWVAGQPAGFFALKQHFPRAAEAYVLGLLPAASARTRSRRWLA